MTYDGAITNTIGRSFRYISGGLFFTLIHDIAPDSDFLINHDFRKIAVYVRTGNVKEYKKYRPDPPHRRQNIVRCKARGTLFFRPDKNMNVFTPDRRQPVLENVNNL